MITSPRRSLAQPSRHPPFRVHPASGSIDRTCISRLDPGRVPSSGTAAVSMRSKRAGRGNVPRPSNQGRGSLTRHGQSRSPRGDLRPGLRRTTGQGGYDRQPARGRHAADRERRPGMRPRAAVRGRRLQREYPGPPGPRAAPGPGRRRGHRPPLHARPGSALTQICLSGPDPRGTHPLRRRGRLPAQPRRPWPRGGPAAPGPGHDRRIRARQDHGALPQGQATRRPPRLGQRAQRRALRLSLRRQARGGRRGALSGPGRRGPGRAEDLRVGRPGAVLDRRGVPTPPARRRPHADRQTGLGPRDGLVDPQEPRLQGDGGVRQDALGRVQAPAPPPPARPPRAAQAAGLTGRYILGRIKSSSKSPGW